ncbi:hypothetical protein FB45DRAFT_1030479 [Roridomyces roridus]|uniref:Uncharacterized protein n=1 Tax=Roridomyces roridus TaxID=1738132 RepID=A0AAD7BNM7_9AGAR|nr:hypothetical protein FB45DRAFT_1030479 [Roridomyces roridus]
MFLNDVGHVSRKAYQYFPSNGIISSVVSVMDVEDRLGTTSSPPRPMPVPLPLLPAIAGFLDHVIVWGERMGPAPISEGRFVDLLDQVLPKHLVY